MVIGLTRHVSNHSFDIPLPDGYKAPVVSNDLFPSGPWIGFYMYSGSKEKYRMDLDLSFANGRLSGVGSDNVGRFFIHGRYDATKQECHWTKTYLGGHDVFYRGFREGKGIWGVWEIGMLGRGGFHIWPLHGGGSEAENAEKEQTAPVEAVGTANPTHVERFNRSTAHLVITTSRRGSGFLSP